jgi:hypothetical protein
MLSANVDTMLLQYSLLIPIKLCMNVCMYVCGCARTGDRVRGHIILIKEIVAYICI